MVSLETTGRSLRTTQTHRTGLTLSWIAPVDQATRRLLGVRLVRRSWTTRTWLLARTISRSNRASSRSICLRRACKRANTTFCSDAVIALSPSRTISGVNLFATSVAPGHGFRSSDAPRARTASSWPLPPRVPRSTRAQPVPPHPRAPRKPVPGRPSRSLPPRRLVGTDRLRPGLPRWQKIAKSVKVSGAEWEYGNDRGTVDYAGQA